MVNQAEIYENIIERNLTYKSKEVVNNYRRMRRCNEKKMYEEILNERLFPYKVDIEPTTKCFLHCRYCQVPYWSRNKLHNLSIDDFISIVDSMPYLLEMKLQGQGEPLLNSDLFKMIEYATNNKIIVRFNTNGILLNETNRKEILKCGLFELRISMDGATKKTNELMRCGLDFEKVINNVRKLSELRRSNQLPLLNVWMLLTQNNLAELVDMVDLCHEMGVDGLKVQTKLSTRDDEDIEKRVVEDTIDVNCDEVKKIFEKAMLQAKEKDIDLEIITNKWRTKENPCWWLWNSAYISLDGFVVPCSIINDPESLNFGNIREETFYDIWCGEKYNQFRNKILDMNICDLCKWCYNNVSQEIKG